MSSPIQIAPAPPPHTHAAERDQTRLPTLKEFFAPGGLLSQSSLAFEHRPGQFEMARAVESALTDKRHLIVEAGTGTGKTLAYLLPALRLARAERQQRIIISTGTKKPSRNSSTSRTVPFLESILGPLKVCYMKSGPQQLSLPPQALRPACRAAAQRFR